MYKQIYIIFAFIQNYFIFCMQYSRSNTLKTQFIGLFSIRLIVDMLLGHCYEITSVQQVYMLSLTALPYRLSAKSSPFFQTSYEVSLRITSYEFPRNLKSRSSEHPIS